MSDILTRRALLGGLGCACCMGLTGAVDARIGPRSMTPLIQAGYRPTEEDEKGLWQQYERVEQEIAGSNLLVEDKALTAYLGGLAERVGGPAARDLRVYLAHIPEFNAFMAPTGFMVVFSGLLTRMRDEAQLSGVIAHEAGHFLRRHHVRGWRDMKRKTDILAVAAMGAGVGGAAAGAYMGDAVRLAYMGTILSLFATHPAPAERMADLRLSAQEVKNGAAERGRDRYLKTLGEHRARFLDDQVKLNDPGASLYIVQNLAKDGWTGLLRYYEAEIWRLRGEKGDDARAAQGYATAVQLPDAPAEAWRAHGYALLKAGRRDEGKQALGRYLAMAPQARDAAMVRYSLTQ